MNFLYDKYRKSEKNNMIWAVEIFRAVGISDEQNKSTVRNSRYLDLDFDDAREAFKLSDDGVQYMDKFYELVSYKYHELAGLVKNDEMVNKDKADRARQWAREHIENGMRIEDTHPISIYNETILGDKVITTGDHNRTTTGKKFFGTNKARFLTIITVMIGLASLVIAYLNLIK